VFFGRAALARVLWSRVLSFSMLEIPFLDGCFLEHRVERHSEFTNFEHELFFCCGRGEKACMLIDGVVCRFGFCKCHTA
jgi:hypothetical protein